MSETSQRKITTKEMAAELSCSESTIRRLKLAGRLPFVQPGGKGHMVRYPQGCLDSDPNLQVHPLPEKSPDHVSGSKPKWLTEYEQIKTEAGFDDED